MSTEPSTVECPECGEGFDPSKAGGFCTNPECGEYRYEGDNADDNKSPSGDTVTCAACGDNVPDERYCKECGHELGTDPVNNKPEGNDPGPELDPPTCPSCGKEVQAEWAACPFCQTSLNENNDEEDTDTIDNPEKVVIQVGDVNIEAGDGDTVGRKVRSGHVRAGGDEGEAQYIHREHVRVKLEHGKAFLINEGRNGTHLNGKKLKYEERVGIKDGDELTFSDVATGTIHIE